MTADRVKALAETTIERIRTFEPREGYWVGYSGGKDSTALLDLVRCSGVKYEAHYSATTIDPPEVVRFVRAQHDVTVDRPPKTFLSLMLRKGPPTRQRRWCCKALKEGGGAGRLVITGIRAAESRARAARGMTERCRVGTKTFLHPLIDWTDGDVWRYISARSLAVCSLYAEGYHRIGCLFCPMAGAKTRATQVARWPKYAAAFRRAFDRLWSSNCFRESYAAWKSGDEMWRWWISGDSVDRWRYETDVEERSIGLFDDAED